MELIVLRDGEETRVQVEETGHTHRLRIGDRVYEVDSSATNGVVRSLVIAGQQFEVSVRSRGSGVYQVGHVGAIEEVEVLDPLTYLVAQGSRDRRRGGPRQIEAYMPGRVVQVLVGEGDTVEVGQGLIVLEAMKMENEIQAEHAAKVVRVFVTAGQTVEGGDLLFELE